MERIDLGNKTIGLDIKQCNVLGIIFKFHYKSPGGNGKGLLYVIINSYCCE